PPAPVPPVPGVAPPPPDGTGSVPPTLPEPPAGFVPPALPPPPTPGVPPALPAPPAAVVPPAPGLPTAPVAPEPTAAPAPSDPSGCSPAGSPQALAAIAAINEETPKYQDRIRKPPKPSSPPARTKPFGSTHASRGVRVPTTICTFVGRRGPP